MILTETIVHSHNHGASGFEIFLWVLAAIATMWVLDDGWAHASNRWRAWRETHGSTQVEDATEDGPCGECGGTGKCRYCDGTGEQGVYSGDICEPCYGSGSCACVRVGGWTPNQPAHIGAGANAEDCPACDETVPAYPWICPGDDTARAAERSET